MLLTFAGAAVAAPPKSLALKYWLPDTARDDPASLPVTCTLRPTSVPVTLWPSRLDITLTLRGCVGAVVWQIWLNCSEDRYCVPVTGRQAPASSPVMLLRAPTPVPVTVLPLAVVVISTLFGAVSALAVL